MSYVNGVNSSRVRSSDINPSTHSPSSSVGVGALPFTEKFDYVEFDQDARPPSSICAEERENYFLLCKFFLKILSYKIDIVPQRMRRTKNYVIEASFIPTERNGGYHQLLLPLRGVGNTFFARNYESVALTHLTIENIPVSFAEEIKSLFENSTDSDICHLLTIASHEFGHFLSFVRGHQDKDLRLALSLFHSNHTNQKYMWLIYREEVTAWRFAKEQLIVLNFNFSDLFDEVKGHSLQTYFKVLQLATADVSIIIELSMLGDDFTNNAHSDLFRKARNSSRQSQTNAFY